MEANGTVGLSSDTCPVETWEEDFLLRQISYGYMCIYMCAYNLFSILMLPDLHHLFSVWEEGM